MSISSKKAEQINKDLLEALNKVAAKHGLELKPSRGRFTESNFRKRVEFMAVDSDGETLTKERRDLDHYKARKLGLSSANFGRQFTIPGEGTFELIGFRNRAPKRPLQIRNVETGRIHSCVSVINGMPIAKLLAA